jgi:hypothetical protein
MAAKDKKSGSAEGSGKSVALGKGGKVVGGKRGHL